MNQQVRTPGSTSRQHHKHCKDMTAGTVTVTGPRKKIIGYRFDAMTGKRALLPII
jgi:hypothetical protein